MCETSTGTATIGRPSSVPPISAALASWASMACRRAASLSMSPLRAGRKNFPISPASISSRRRTAATRWWSMRRWMVPVSTGAYRFLLQRHNGVVMEVEARVFPRRDIEQLGIAPMSSMFWFSETSKPTAIDWRPEVHDSDGLALWTGAGEYIWRPLNDPASPSISTFDDKTPRGFGLLQRDRTFDHYLDGVRYDRRPSLWVEPLDDWGEGAVHLVELPTNDETEDNIVAMWVPKQPSTPAPACACAIVCNGARPSPTQTALARCVATRLGRGGEPGKPRPVGVHKFMVEFLGGPLASTALRCQTQTRSVVIVGRLLLCFHGGRARWHTRTLAGAIRFYRRRPQGRRHAAVSQEWRADPLRDLAVSVPYRMTTAAGLGLIPMQAHQLPPLALVRAGIGARAR